MKSLRSAAFSALLTIGAFSAITYTACNSDKCKSVVCSNGTCADGVCSCNVGYEGTLCDSLSTEKFLKNWTAPADKNIASGVTLSPYTCLIAQGTAINTVTISTGFSDNFFAHAINGTVSGTTLTVPSQYPDGSANFAVDGSATYANGELSWTYTITPPSGGGSPKTYTGIWQ